MYVISQLETNCNIWTPANVQLVRGNMSHPECVAVFGGMHDCLMEFWKAFCLLTHHSMPIADLFRVLNVRHNVVCSDFINKMILGCYAMQSSIDCVSNCAVIFFQFCSFTEDLFWKVKIVDFQGHMVLFIKEGIRRQVKLLLWRRSDWKMKMKAFHQLLLEK